MHFFQQRKNLPELNITYDNNDNNRIKQLHTGEHLVCYLNANLSEASMAMKSLKKINAKLQFLYRLKEFQSPI